MKNGLGLVLGLKIKALIALKSLDLGFEEKVLILVLVLTKKSPYFQDLDE